MHILFTRRAGTTDLISRWAVHKGAIISPIDTVSVSALTAVDRAEEVIIFIDYPVETSIDVDTINEFTDQVLAGQGQWYYAPRPNAYVAVEKPALVGIHREAYDATSQLVAREDSVEGPSERMMWLRGKVNTAIDVLPSPLRTVARIAGQRVWRMRYATLDASNEITSDGRSAAQIHSRETDPTGSDLTFVPQVSDPGSLSSVRTMKPQIVVPAALLSWAGEWKTWDGNERTQKRDLLERASTFFPHPMGIHVVVLNKCNLSCVMCPFHSPVYKDGHKSDFFNDYNAMTVETFGEIAAYAGKYRIALQFGQVEEPLMHKRLPEFFHMAKRAGVPNIHLTTNGTLLTPERADQLIDSGLTSLMVSLDADDPDTYRDIRGDDLRAVEDNLRYFIPRAKQRGIKVWVSFILQPRAVQERQAFLEKWRSLGVDNVTFYMLSTHNKETGELVDHKLMYERNEERYPCSSPWIQSVVFPGGEVSLCCRTMGLVGWQGIVSVGSLKEQRYEEIWAGERYRTVRDELLRNEFDKFGICRDCAIWSASTSVVEKASTYERVYNETMETYTFTGRDHHG